MSNSTTVDPSRWDEVGPLLDGGILRPYKELRRMPYYALPGFYADDTVLAFQPGWDAVHWYGPNWPTVAEVRERIVSLLISSWIVQDRDDASRFFLGDEPGSIRTSWGTVPASVVFATRLDQDEDADAPWDNLNAILGHVDAARTLNGIAAEAAPVKAFVEWRLSAPVPPRTRAVFYARDGGGACRSTCGESPQQPGAGLGTASRLRVGTGRTADVNPRGFDSPVRRGFQKGNRSKRREEKI